MTKSYQEIAREAWAHIKGYYAILCNESEEHGGVQIILDAIEEAYHQGANDMDKNYREREKLDAAAQPQRNEPPCTCLQDFGCDTECPAHGSRDRQPVEWTPEYIFELGRNGAGYQTICDAHNAALADEREKWLGHAQTLLHELLQAQAAISNVKTLLQDISKYAVVQEILGQLSHIDQSMLDDHDNEVRKPLVDALKLALLPIAAWKVTDQAERYDNIGPELRSGFIIAHDAIMATLSELNQ